MWKTLLVLVNMKWISSVRCSLWKRTALDADILNSNLREDEILMQVWKKHFVCVDTLAVSNAECERGFSSMNRIITKQRNRLTTEHTSHILFIRTVGQPISNWKPDLFIETWIRAGRRPAYSVGCMRRKNKDPDNYFQSAWKTFQ